MITAERVRELFTYDPETGELRWRKTGRIAGEVLLRPKGNGNGRRVQLTGDKSSRVLAHHLIWLMQTGSWPTGQIDHINLDALDNRWANLREATASQNMANRRSWGRVGLKGVSRTRYGKFMANLMKDGRAFYLGTFDTAEKAHAAYVAAAQEHHGEFARSA